MEIGEDLFFQYGNWTTILKFDGWGNCVLNRAAQIFDMLKDKLKLHNHHAKDEGG